jgi:hypothetical protein
MSGEQGGQLGPVQRPEMPFQYLATGPDQQGGGETDDSQRALDLSTVYERYGSRLNPALFAGSTRPTGEGTGTGFAAWTDRWCFLGRTDVLEHAPPLSRLYGKTAEGRMNPP